MHIQSTSLEYRIAGDLGKFRNTKSPVKDQFLHNTLEIERQINECLVKNAGIHADYYGNIEDKNYCEKSFLSGDLFKCIRFIQENKKLKKDSEEKVREGIKTVFDNNKTLRAVSTEIWRDGTDFGEIWPIISPKIFTSVDQAINEGIIGTYISKINYDLNIERNDKCMIIEYELKPTTQSIDTPKDFLKDVIRKYVRQIKHRKNK